MRVVGKVNRVFTKVRKRLTSLTTVEVEMTESPVNPMYREHNAGGSISDEQSKPTVNPLSLPSSPSSTWVQAYDEASESTYFYNEKTGESRWEDEVDGERKVVTGKKRYSQEVTEEGEIYYVPESDEDGDTVWDLPENGILVSRSS